MPEFFVRQTALCALLLALRVSVLFAQEHGAHFELGDPIFHTIAGAESIPENVASFMIQDRSGFLWIGTPDGVVRYDGYTFRTFRHDPHDPRSLSENHVRTMHAARDGRVWIGTSDAGVSVFDPATESFRTLSVKSGGLVSDNIRAFADGDSGLWIATTAGLDFVDEKTLRVMHVEATPPDARNPDRAKLGSLLMDSRGDLWIGSADGLAVRRKNGVVEAAGLRGEARHSLAGKPVYRIFQARDGAFWLGFFGGGLARFDPQSGVSRIIDEKVRGYSFAQPEQDTIWIGTTGDGIESRDPSTGALLLRFQHDASVPESLPSNRVTSLFVDRSGIAWIGTTGRGLARYNPADGAFRILRHSPRRSDALSNGEIESVFESSDGLLWVGTHDNGVDVFDTRRRIAGYRAGADARSLDSANIGAIAETEDGSMWFGGFGSLVRLDRKSGRIERFPPLPFGKTSGRITTLLPSADGKGLWTGTNLGLLFFDRTNRSWAIAELADGKKLTGVITDIAFDASGNLWVTTTNGMAALTKESTQFSRFTSDRNTAGTLPAGSTLDLLLDSRNRLWIGMSNGLIRLTAFDGRTARFESIAPQLGMENRRCDNLLEDHAGHIWIEDNAVFDPATFRKVVFGPDEGAGRSIWRGAAIRTSSGQFVLGGPDGLFFINPAARREWTYAPPVVLTSIRIDGVSRPPAQLGEISIEPGTKTAAFEFAALDFSAPHRNRYSYRLNGFDPQWTEVDATHRTATFTSLPPGNYSLEVRGSNRDGVWGASTIKVPLRVHPAFYQTTLFKIVAALLLVGLTWPLYRIRLHMLEARHHELEALVEKRTAEVKESEQRALEASQAKTVFLANMSHELRTPLNATLGFSRLMRRSPNLSAADRENLSIVERSGEHLLSLINQVLSISKIEAGRMTLDQAVFDLREMIHTIERMFQTRAEEEGLRFMTFVDDAVPRTVRGDEGKLRQAIINLLGNAVKFTAAGSVSFSVRASGDRVVFEVTDTGRGIDAAELPLLFLPFQQTESGRAAAEGTGLGLAITKRIIELMGGTIAIESRLGEGSTFRFDIPMERSEEAVVRKHSPRVLRIAEGQTPPRILVADDTPENRALLVRLLAIVGCDVREAENGATALSVWREWHPQLVFMDMRMPVMDGREATRRIRAEEPDERTVIVATTASVYEQDRDTLLADGVDEVIFKPYREEAIFDAITSRLSIRFESEPAGDGPRRILLTDDDFVNRAVAREMLRLAAFEVVEATNGEEALALLAASGPFDAVLLDVEMPRMGGIETVRRIRADSRFSRIPVVALTAHSDPDDLKRLTLAGMDDHLSKPFEAEDLKAKLSRWFQRN